MRKLHGLIALLPLAVVACSGAPAEDTASNASALGLCPPGYTASCETGPTGKPICECIKNPTSHTVGGTVSGLLPGASLVVADNEAYVEVTDQITGQAGPDGGGLYASYALTLTGSGYSLFLTQQPTSQACSIANFQGSSTGNVTNANITCGPPSSLGIDFTGSVPPSFQYSLGGVPGSTSPIQQNVGASSLSGNLYAIPWALPPGSTPTLLVSATGYTCVMESPITPTQAYLTEYVQWNCFYQG